MHTIYDLYDEYNAKYFYNSLPYIDIYLVEDLDALGYFDHTDDDDLFIELRYPHYDFKATLLHEMLHFYQYLNHLPIDHGSFFQRAARRLGRLTKLNIL